MLRFAAAAVIVLGLVAVRPASAADMAKTAKGTVKSVAADSLTITDKDGKDMTFNVGTKTKVVMRGGSHKSAEMKAMGKVPQITDSVKVGDKVSVKYWMSEEKMQAGEVTLQ